MYSFRSGLISSFSPRYRITTCLLPHLTTYYPITPATQIKRPSKVFVVGNKANAGSGGKSNHKVKFVDSRSRRYFYLLYFPLEHTSLDINTYSLTHLTSYRLAVTASLSTERPAASIRSEPTSRSPRASADVNCNYVTSVHQYIPSIYQIEVRVTRNTRRQVQHRS